MVPDSNRINEIMFYWFMRELQAVDVVTLQGLIETICAYSAFLDPEGVGADASTISKLRLDAFGFKDWTPSVNETIWTLRKLDYSYGEIGQLLHKSKSNVQHMYARIKEDKHKQVMIGSTLDQTYQIQLDKFMRAKERLDLLCRTIGL